MPRRPMSSLRLGQRAQLTLSWAEDGELEVQWPSAIDNVGVTGYAVRINTAQPVQVGDVNHIEFKDQNQIVLILYASSPLTRVA